ncbi:hypothetical protein RRSL_03954 [Ralstonia solanacearum UW551]|uniref:Uncharacterized protein n=2 Tax=Ralstonia solanacearum TaxID=305 RepID=A0ABF7RGF8_RALSL|nr:hypothetical protein RRSL_03954 [Ralstonia solanacearum UW551]CEJ20707.1 hypothetical protein RSIPO_04921 [Ralstonia solanacearum IPO1609]
MALSPAGLCTPDLATHARLTQVVSRCRAWCAFTTGNGAEFTTHSTTRRPRDDATGPASTFPRQALAERRKTPCPAHTSPYPSQVVARWPASYSESALGAPLVVAS